MIKIIKLHEDATFFKAHPTDAGYDLTCIDVIKKDEDLYWLDLGIQTQPPEGHYFELVPRSSFPKSGFVMANSIGIIDEGYRGTWYMQIRPINMYPEKWYTEKVSRLFLGKRVAQAILKRNENGHEITFVNELSNSERGKGGFGSTDKK